MEPITAESPEAQSADLIAENIKKLKDLFPELVTEAAQGHSVNVDVLKQLVGDQSVTDVEEKYGLNWHGKRAARKLALTPSLGTLRPCPDDSVEWENTQHLFIEGDNLEVLKLLQKSYAGKVKLIYIDPPYNTGKDFVYPDNFKDNIRNYKQLTGQVDSEGRAISSNSEASGRFHTDWLNMMYPRLKVARNLMRNDGVIFISIDDVENANVRHVCNEVFGEENFIGNIVWKNVTDNNPSNVATEHEYIVAYAKSKIDLEPIWKSDLSKAKDILVEIGDELIKKYEDQELLQAVYSAWFRENKHQLWPLENYKFIDENGIYSGERGVHNPGKEGYRYDIIHPITKKPCKEPLMGYRFPEETMNNLIEEGRIIFGDDEDKLVEIKVYAKDYKQKLGSVINLDGRAGSNELKELFPETKKVFTNPKTTRLLEDLFSFVCSGNDIILDFFSGSGSSAHAAYKLNSEDCGQRKFVSVQLPETTYELKNGKQIPRKGTAGEAFKAGYNNIAEIAKERLRRAAAKIKTEHPDYDGDLGFRVFKLDSSNIKAWNAEAIAAAQTDEEQAALLNEQVDHLLADRTEDDILYELLLKLGLDLCVPIEQREIAGKTVYSVGAGVLMVCLADSITYADSEALAQGIVDWHKALAPATEVSCVFRDSGFADDKAKANTTAILEQAGLKKVRSL